MPNKGIATMLRPMALPAAMVTVVGHILSTMALRIIQTSLSNDAVQRIVYGLGLSFWIFLMWDRIIEYPFEISPIGLNYLTLFIIPALLLVIQIIRNNQILWGLIFGLMTIYIIITLYLLISDAIERSGNHVKAIDWRINDIGLFLFVFVVLFIVDFVIFMIRPRRLI